MTSLFYHQDSRSNVGAGPCSGVSLAAAEAIGSSVRTSF